MTIDLAALAACLFIIAALAAVLIAAEVLAYRTKVKKAAAFQPRLDRDDLLILFALVAGLDEAVKRYIAAVQAGGRDEDAIALLGLLDRAGVNASRLGPLTTALARAACDAPTDQPQGKSTTGAPDAVRPQAPAPGKTTGD